MSISRARLVTFTAAILVGAGLAVFFNPRSVMVIGQLMLAALAVVATAFVLTTNAPAAWWTSPFDRTDGEEVRSEPQDETAWIRTRFEGRRVALGDGRWALPPETLRLLRPLIEESVSGRAAESQSLEAPLTPLMRAVLDSDPTIQPGWIGTQRADPAAVARLVDRFLDDLQELESGALPVPSFIEPGEERPQV